ncbi:type II toxin-antitoxin system RelE/ParE family toxin [Litoreibacter janthinus]|uniref:Plasmid stabilization system protein ParE n=1 Tax=Litoreibacter janthinus TaxID=670154 RepID=A0A1I6IC97_9RHOB|nr:type II toxin-antitoxin system RelE/ParE family toxin [Litoreibacter janthinus]SFR64377.1 Plasmid stabilization system protein ParE [Litoreibacter janthinus]
MSRSFRLTRRAEDSLVAIARWTFDTFGPRQADLYEAELIHRCEAIAMGEAVSQSCALLCPEVEDMRFARAGEHFVVFLDRPDAVIVIDILHSRSDLPGHVRALATLAGPGRLTG